MFARPSVAEITERNAQRKEANLRGLAIPSRGLHQGTYEGASTAPAPKSEPRRNPALLEIARGRPCLLLIPAICNHRLDTTVACHSNLSIHGKSLSRKADDVYIVHGCAACHTWLDTSGAPAAQKEAAFMAAHMRQVFEWRLIAVDGSEPERFRNAARWALDQLNATPTPQ